MSGASQRIDYDLIAHLYDAQPFREKAADPKLGETLAARSAPGRPRALDLGCGTGNQQVANQAAWPGAALFGADLFLGMLRQARAKSDRVGWIQADGSRLPFASCAFAYVSNQYSLHHVKDKAGLFREVHRVLEPKGRFCLQNVCPEGMLDRAVYRYFPETKALDLRDYLPVQGHLELLAEAGFVNVRHRVERRPLGRPLLDFRAYVGRKDVTSELVALSEEEWRAGLERIDRDLAAGVKDAADVVCLLQVEAERG